MISLNDYSRDIDFSSTDRIAFGAFKNPDESICEYSKCDLNDNWDQPSYINGPLNIISSSLSDTTFRGYGTDRYIFYSDSKILTNTEKIDTGSITGARINTNSIDLTNVFIGYAFNDSISVRHIDP